MLALDTETELIRPGLLAPPLVCVSWARSGAGSGVVPGHEAGELLVEALYEGFIGLNISFDCAVICAEYPDLIDLVFDTYRTGRIQDVGLNQGLIDIAQGRFKFYDKKKGSYSLAGLSKRLLKIDVDKDDSPRLDYGRLRGLPLSEYPQGHIDYAKLDAELPLQIWEHQLKHKQYLDNGPFRAYADFALQLASCWGVYSDPGRCKKLELELERTLDESRVTLQDAGLVRANGTRDTKVAKERMKRLCSDKGVPWRLTDKGQVSLDKEACVITGDEVMLAYSVYVSANTLRDRVRDLSQGTGLVPLQPRYHSLKDTGRTSASKGKNGFQIQNMPQLEGARETLEPRKGCLFFGADFSAAEMHAFAQIMIDLYGQSKLADTLNAGLCPHVSFGAALRGMTYEQVDNSPDRSKIRSLAKPGNFGIRGGMGAATFVSYAAGYSVYLNEDEARNHIATLKMVDPEMAMYLRQIGDTVNRGTTQICFPRANHWRGGLTYSAMANGSFQTLCAYAALDALCEVQRQCYSVPSSPLYGCRVWGYVHDEILAEGPAEQAPEAADHMAQVMAERFNQWVPDVPTTADPAVFLRWSKGNEGKRDTQGRLILSESLDPVLPSD